VPAYRVHEKRKRIDHNVPAFLLSFFSDRTKKKINDNNTMSILNRTHLNHAPFCVYIVASKPGLPGGTDR
jgi:hypothetical protein